MEKNDRSRNLGEKVFISRICLVIAALTLVAIHPGASYAGDEPALGAGESPVTAPPPPPTPTPPPATPPPSTPPPSTPPPSTPTPAQCSYFTIDARFHHDGDDYGSEHGKNMFRARPGTSNDELNKLVGLQCMQTMFQNCGVPKGELPKTDGFERVRDDCVFLALTALAGKDCGSLSKQQVQCAKTGGRCKNTSDPVKGKCRDKDITVTLNSNCEVATPTDPSQICGHFLAFGLFTPVSLLWSPQADITSVFQIVKFQMNPYEAPRWQTWRASAETPLLVFDPEHTGRIVSGSQLFGSWTWGGRSYASLGDLMDGAPRSEWRSGYEALAQLDSNHNNKLDGEELKPLALWFDKNQDGKSQPGEVVAVGEMGITALFVQPESYDPHSKTMHASLGYERTVDGKTIRGSSVDWYGQTTDSKFEMLFREQSRSVLEQSLHRMSLDTEKGNAELGSPRPGNSETAAENPAAPFTGPWVWHLEGDSEIDSPTQGGLLFLTNGDRNGEVAGSSYIELPVRDRSGIDQRVVSRMQVQGRTSANTIHFQIVSDGAVMTDSVATLSADGMELRGNSAAKILKKEGRSEYTTLKYSWVATRY
jgi:hypothetical protein